MDYLKYFPGLSKTQLDQLNQLPALYHEWNDKINVISRKDIANIEERHILHSLSIVHFVKFLPDSEILDLGTGGGFPGVPLAIYYPDTKFYLLDSRNKKLNVINEICTELGLKNVKTIHSRIEDHSYKYDFVVTRAVARLKKLKTWTQGIIKEKQKHAIPNGIIALKGGNLRMEILEIKRANYVEHLHLQQLWKEKIFMDKSLIYVQG